MPAPIPANIEESIVKQLVRKKAHKDIVAHVKKEFDRHVNIQTIGKIRARNLERITNAQSLVQTNAAVQAIDIQNRAYRLLDKKLERAEVQDDEMEKIRKKYRDGQIDHAEYRRRIEAYENVTIGQISQVLTSVKEDKNAPKGVISPEDQAALELLAEGIRSGNPVNLIQILNQTTGENPGA